MPPFYDTHAHLDFDALSVEIEAVVERATAAEITRIVTIGTELDSSRQSIGYSEQFEGVYAVAGWHPCSALEAPEDLRPALREMAEHPKVVALGETGLDYYHLPSQKEGNTEADDLRYKERQAELFRQHLEVAAETGLNCVIHQRSAFEETLRILKPFADKVRGVFHCFVNDADSMRRILEMNSLVSFTGILTFKNAQEVRDTLSETPMGSFMLETDSPYLAPVPYRGKRCEPAYVSEIAKVAAEVKGVSMEDLSEATSSAAHAFFRGF